MTSHRLRWLAPHSPRVRGSRTPLFMRWRRRDHPRCFVHVLWTDLDVSGQVGDRPPTCSSRTIPSDMPTTVPDRSTARYDHEQLLATLNERQREAVTAPDGPILVIAGPGSGKTRVICARIAHLVRTGRSEPARIAALTFTRKAANEMAQRVLVLDCRPRPGGSRGDTLHSGCTAAPWRASRPGSARQSETARCPSHRRLPALLGLRVDHHHDPAGDARPRLSLRTWPPPGAAPTLSASGRAPTAAA